MIFFHHKYLKLYVILTPIEYIRQRIKFTKYKTIKKLPKIKGVKEILYPGQNKVNKFKNNRKKEIAISKTVLKDLKYLQSI